MEKLLQSSERKTIFRCDHCGKLFGYKNHLTKLIANVHFELHPFQGTFTCDVCSKKWEARRDVSIHYVAMHLKPKLSYGRHADDVICDHCGTRCDKKDVLVRHIQTEHLERASVVCEVCGAVQSSIGSLCCHMAKIHDSIECQCDVCDKVFKHKAHLRHHILSVHREANQSLSCSFCPAVFKHQITLKRHLGAKHGPKDPSVICDDCGDTFSDLRNLPKHMTDAHTKERGFGCEQCGNAFIRKAHLQQHKANVHERSAIVMCDCCLKIFRQKENLMYHCRSMLNPLSRPLKCETCGLRFKYKYLLTEHQFQHLV